MISFSQGDAAWHREQRCRQDCNQGRECDCVKDDLVKRLNEPERHYPANFDTPKRANAILSSLCQEAADEIERLRKNLFDHMEMLRVQNDYNDDRLAAENKRLRELLTCVETNLSKGMSKSIQQLQAREIRAVLKEKS